MGLEKILEITNKMFNFDMLKKAGKSYIIGKFIGTSIGLTAGLLIGREILERIQSDYEIIVWGIKLTPPLIGLYAGQKIGGWAGLGYYYKNRKNS